MHFYGNLPSVNVLIHSASSLREARMCEGLSSVLLPDAPPWGSARSLPSTCSGFPAPQGLLQTVCPSLLSLRPTPPSAFRSVFLEIY